MCTRSLISCFIGIGKFVTLAIISQVKNLLLLPVTAIR